MPTLGYDQDFTDGAEWWGSGADNQHAIPLTMPEDGTITDIGVWLRGKDASCSFRAAVWSSTRNSVITNTGLQTASGAAFAIGASSRYINPTTPAFIAGGSVIYVGFCRNPTGAMQFDWDASSSHYDDDNGSASPSAMSGETLHSGRKFGAFVVYETGSDTFVRRGGVWVKANPVQVRRGAGWVNPGSDVYVRRGGVWVKA